MKQSEPGKRAFQLLDEFERLENIQPSPEWEKTLFAKMASSRPAYSNTNKGLTYAVVVACFLLINTVFFLKLSGPGTNQAAQRNDVLQSISNELFINSTALK